MTCNDPATLDGLAHYVGEYLRHNEQLTAHRDDMDDYSNVGVKYQRRRHSFQDLTVHRDAKDDYSDSTTDSASSTLPSKDHLAAIVGSILESTLRAGVGRRAIPTHSYRLADPAIDTISGASRFYASSVACSKHAKKKHTRYQPSLAQIKERGNRHTLWQNTWIIVCMALIPICLLVTCLVFLVVSDDEPPAAIDVANILTRKIVGNMTLDLSWKNLPLSRIAVQVLVLPYIFPTPFGLIVQNFESKKEV